VRDAVWIMLEFLVSHDCVCLRFNLVHSGKIEVMLPKLWANWVIIIYGNRFLFTTFQIHINLSKFRPHWTLKCVFFWDVGGHLWRARDLSAWLKISQNCKPILLILNEFASSQRNRERIFSTRNFQCGFFWFCASMQSLQALCGKNLFVCHIISLKPRFSDLPVPWS
jgi:hypothetical protein